MHVHIVCLAFCFFLRKINGTSTIDLTVSSIQEEHVNCSETQGYKVLGIPKADGFVMFEVHSQWYNVTVSYTNNVTYGQYENGTDVGLIMRKQKICYVRCQNPSQKEQHFKILVKVTLHNAQDPVPGGCNMEFPLEEDPNIHIHPGKYTQHLAFQYANHGQTPLIPMPKCETEVNVKHLKYRLFEYHLRSGDLTENEYFASLKAVLNGNSTLDITEIGGEVKTLQGSAKTETIFASYKGNGVIYSVVVEQYSIFINSTQAVTRSMYVPAVRYSCGLGGLNCTYLPAVEVAAAVLIAFLGVAGIFIAYMGHRFFQIEMFFFGYMALKILLLVILMHFTDFSLAAAGVLVLGVGLVGGVLWWLLWYLKGIAVVSVLIPGFVTGFVVACVLFNYTPLGFLGVFQIQLNFGLAFASTIMIPSVVLLYFTRFFNLFSCAFVGSFLPVFAASLLLPGTFRNIILDTFKTLSDPDYLTSIRYLALDINDIIFCVLWFLLFATSLTFQIWRERKRPPFQPCPYDQYKKKLGSRSGSNLAPVNNDIDAQWTPPPLQSNNRIVNSEREPLITSTWHPSMTGRSTYGGTSPSPGSRLQTQRPEIVDPI